jgi:gas vesicle protein
MSEDHGRADAKFLFGLFLGGIIGALIIFFLGTKEGKKAGKLIEEKGKEALDDLHGAVDDLQKKGKELVKQGDVIKERLVENLEHSKEELTEVTTEKLESALTKIEQLQEQSMTATAEIRKRFFKNIPKKK